jgi:hypothetical protein
MNPLSAGRMALLGAVLLAPFVLLALDAAPQADDFACGRFAERDGVWGEARHLYVHWTGRYAASAALAWCGLDLERSAVAVPLLLLGAWWLGCWRCFHVVARAWGRRLPEPRAPSRRWTGALSLLALAFYVTRMPSPCQGLYWLSGSVTYTPTGALSWFLIAELVHLFDPRTTERRRLARHAFTASGLVVLLVGFNETVMFLWCLALGTLFAMSWSTRRRTAWLAPVVASAAIAAAIVIAAPGNATRSNGEGSGRFAKSVGRSITHAATKFAVWSLDPGLWAVSLLFVPALRRSPPPFHSMGWLRHPRSLPAIVSGTLAAMALGAFPVYFASGVGPPLRLTNLLYVVFAGGWFLAVYSFALSAPRWAPERTTMGGWRVATALLFLYGNWPRAVWDECLLAKGFRDELAARARRVDDAVARGETRLELDPLHTRPKTIFYADLRPDPDYWVNDLFAKRMNVATAWVRDDSSSATRR